MKEITLKLNIEEVNLLLMALGNMPYIQVHDFINRIQQQAKTQLREKENPEAENYNGNPIEKVLQ